VLGNEIFDTFAIGYLQENPSRSYTLARLGANFPDFLEQTRPDARATSVDPPGAKLSVDKATAGWTDFLIDLTRLERTINEVFDGPGPEGRPLLDGARLTAITPEEWFQARLNCVPSLRLVRFRYPVNEFFTAIRRNEKPPIPEPEPSRLAISRRDFRVLRYPLEPAQYELLQAVLEGKSVGAAVERAAALSPLDDPRLAVAIREWFHFWTAEGFFRGVTTPLTS